MHVHAHTHTHNKEIIVIKSFTQGRKKETECLEGFFLGVEAGFLYVTSPGCPETLGRPGGFKLTEVHLPLPLPSRPGIESISNQTGPLRDLKKDNDTCGHWGKKNKIGKIFKEEGEQDSSTDSPYKPQGPEFPTQNPRACAHNNK